MALPLLNFDFDESAYSIAFGNEVASVAVQGGPARRRRDFIGAPNIVAVQWVLDPFQYQAFMAFYRNTLIKGVLPFTTNMMIDDGAIELYQCAFVENTLQLSGISGEARILTAQLEVIGLVDSTNEDSNDETIAMLYDIYGDDAPNILNLLAKLANVDLPMMGPQ